MVSTIPNTNISYTMIKYSHLIQIPRKGAYCYLEWILASLRLKTREILLKADLKG